MSESTANKLTELGVNISQNTGLAQSLPAKDYVPSEKVHYPENKEESDLSAPTLDGELRAKHYAQLEQDTTLEEILSYLNIKSTEERTRKAKLLRSCKLQRME